MAEQLSHVPENAQMMPRTSKQASQVKALMAETTQTSSEVQRGNNQVTGKETERTDAKYDLVIFDFHGTMTDHPLRLIRALHHAGHETFGIHLGREFYQEALHRPPHALKNEGREDIKAQTTKEFIEDKLKDTSTMNPHGKDPKLKASYTEEEREEYFRRYRHYMESTFIPVPGIKNTVQELRADNIEVVVLTNGSKRELIQETLNDWGLSELADDLYSSHIMEDKAKKPDVRVVKRILDDFEAKHGFRPTNERVLMIGDYIDDIKTARNMGMDSVLMSRGMGGETIELRDPKPTFILTDPKDLLKIVKGEFEQEIGDNVTIPVVLWKRIK